MPIRVLAVDDHPVVRAGVCAVLANESDIVVVGEAADGSQAIALYAKHRPDVVLMDLRLPGLTGIEATRTIIATDPGARILALTSYDGDADIYRAFDAGARGYLLKETLGAEVVGAIRTLMAGGRVIPPEIARRLAEFVPRRDLTPREYEVLLLAAKGLSNHEIARRIGRTHATAKAHLKNAMAKLGAQDRTAAVTLALRRGIIHLD